MKNLIILIFAGLIFSCAQPATKKQYMILIGDSIAEGHPLAHGRLHKDYGAEMDLTKPNEEGQLSYYFEKQFHMACLNQGIGGHNSNNIWRGRWQRDVLPNDGTHESTNPYNINPSIVYIHVGINDIAANASYELVTSNIKNMVESARGLGAVVYLDTIGPDITKDRNTELPWFTPELQERAKAVNDFIWSLSDPQVHVIDYLKWASNGTMDFLTLKPGMFADTVHPNKEGYADFAKFVDESLR